MKVTVKAHSFIKTVPMLSAVLRMMGNPANVSSTYPPHQTESREAGKNHPQSMDQHWVVTASIE